MTHKEIEQEASRRFCEIYDAARDELTKHISPHIKRFKSIEKQAFITYREEADAADGDYDRQHNKIYGKYASVRDTALKDCTEKSKSYQAIYDEKLKEANKVRSDYLEEMTR